MINYFLSKPPTSAEEDYDSEDEEEEDGVGTADYDEDDEELDNVGAKQHLDPQSYSWCLLR